MEKCRFCQGEGTVKDKINGKEHTCAHCEGTGNEPILSCSLCRGTGEIEVDSDRGLSKICPACKGTGDAGKVR